MSFMSPIAIIAGPTMQDGSVDLHSVASGILASDPGAGTETVATAIENDTGTGANVPSPNTTSTDVFSSVEKDILANLAMTGTSQSDASANGDNTLAIEKQLAQSAASGGQNQPLGPQLSLMDVSSSTTTGSGSSNNGILILGFLVVLGIAGYFWWKHHKKTPAAE